MNTHDKHYNNELEYQARFKIYREAMGFIRAFNFQKNSFKLGTNPFTDLTREEFKNLYTSNKMYTPNSNPEKEMQFINLEVPREVNWV